MNSKTYIRIAGAIILIGGIIAVLNLALSTLDGPLIALIVFVSSFLLAIVYYGIGIILEELEDIKKALKNSTENEELF